MDQKHELLPDVLQAIFDVGIIYGGNLFLLYL